MIRDRLVCGTEDDAMQEVLSRKESRIDVTFVTMDYLHGQIDICIKYKEIPRVTLGNDLCNPSLELL